MDYLRKTRFLYDIAGVSSLFISGFFQFLLSRYYVMLKDRTLLSSVEQWILDHYDSLSNTQFFLSFLCLFTVFVCVWKLYRLPPKRPEDMPYWISPRPIWFAYIIAYIFMLFNLIRSLIVFEW